MKKYDQLDGDVTLALLLGRDAVKITKADDGQWYEIEAITVSNRRLVARFTALTEGEVPEEVLNVMSVNDYEDGKTSHEHVRKWLRDAANAGVIYVQHYIHAYGMDDSQVFASFLGRECTEEEE